VLAARNKIYQQTTFLKTFAMFAEARKRISFQNKKFSPSKKTSTKNALLMGDVFR
jgi:hypothetical protein